MLPLFGVLVSLFGGSLAFYYRDVYFSRSVKRVAFLGFAIIMLIQQTIHTVVCVLKQEYFRVMFTDLCMMICLLVIIGGIFYIERLLKLITPWAFIGSLLTLFGTNTSFHPPSYALQFELSAHALMLVFAFMSVTMLKDFTKKDFYGSIIFILLFLTFIFITCSAVVAISGNPKYYFASTAMFKYTYTDHFGGDGYSFFSKLGVPYPIPTIIFYLLGLTLNVMVWWMISKYQRKPIISKKLSNEKSLVTIEE